MGCYMRNKGNYIKLLKTVSITDASTAIGKKYLNHQTLEKTNHDSTHLYVIAQIDVPTSRIFLNKVLFYIDFKHCKKHHT